MLRFKGGKNYFKRNALGQRISNLPAQQEGTTAVAPAPAPSNEGSRHDSGASMDVDEEEETEEIEDWFR